jgi:hypothetical protein
MIVTGVPTAPEIGLMLTMLGMTEKLTPLLATEPTVTTTLPLVAPGGTGTTMLELLQLVGMVPIPLKVTELPPCMELKPVPAIVTEAPIWANEGVSEAMLGLGGVTVKVIPLLAVPPTLTTIFPVAAAAGTAAVITVLLQLVIIVAAAPLNVTVLSPCEDPKFAPEIVTSELMGPAMGLIEVMLGAAGVTVMVEVADLVGSTMDVALTVTVGGLGTDEGAI